MAADVLARKLSGDGVLNRIGKYAIEHNMEVARKCAGEEGLWEMGMEPQDI